MEIVIQNSVEKKKICLLHIQIYTLQESLVNYFCDGFLYLHFVLKYKNTRPHAGFGIVNYAKYFPG